MAAVPATSQAGARSSFSQWAGRQQASTQGKQEDFLVINHLLLSRSKGVRYRNSPRIRDINKQKTALFGDVVTGVRIGADWVQVGDLYLPVRIDGKCILLLQEEADDDRAQQEREEEAIRNGHPVLVDSLMRNRKLRGPLVTDPEMQSGPSYQMDANSRGDERRTELIPGTGVLYQVVAAQVDVRPDLRSGDDAENGCLFGGSLVELFDWDDLGRSRRCLYKALGAPRSGWVALDALGPLLRPKELLHRQLPLDPMFTAVYENNTQHLQRLIERKADLNLKDSDGYTPLMHAASFGSGDCCILLLQHNADAAVRVATDRPSAATILEPVEEQTRRTLATATSSASDLASSNLIKALIQGLTGDEDFSVPDFDAALEKLQPKMQDVAEAMLDRIAQGKEARRRQQQAEEEELFQKALKEADSLKQWEQEEEASAGSAPTTVPISPGLQRISELLLPQEDEYSPDLEQFHGNDDDVDALLGRRPQRSSDGASSTRSTDEKPVAGVCRNVSCEVCGEKMRRGEEVCPHCNMPVARRATRWNKHAPGASVR